MGGLLDPSAAALVCAFALDLAAGEPPNRFHPVAWLGRAVSATLRAAPGSGAAGQLLFGACVALFIPAACALVGAGIAAVLDPGSVLGLAVTAVALKATISVRALGDAAAVVRGALVRGDLAAARAGLRSLCSRDPTALEADALVAATVESVAENASDAFVAPVFYFLLFGLAGAFAYRAVNTLDSMIGYHGRFEYLGKASARLDDLANLVPARLTALLLIVAGALLGKDARLGCATLRRDGANTESPNAGRPMAAMAGLLRVELSKAGHYRLGEAIEPLGAAKIEEARMVLLLASSLAVALSAVLLGARRAYVG